MIAVLTAGFLLAANPTPGVEACFFMVREADGRFGIVADPGLAKTLKSPTTPLPKAMPNLAAVQCARPTLTLADGDERILLEYKVPMYIQDGNRVLVLEIDKGQLQVRFDAGAPTEAELTALQESLDTLQLKIQGEL